MNDAVDRGADSYWRKPHDWLGSGWGYRAESNESLMYALSRIGTHHTGKRYVWRGVSDATHRMSSGLWRKVANDLERPPTEAEVREYEVHVLNRARDWGIGSDQGILPTEFHLSAILQHEGVPTRFLDVTSNPMTALWFACAADLDKPGVLLALEVSDWQTYRTTESFSDSWMGANGTDQIEVAAKLSPDPFLVVPKNASGRLAAQEGLFVSSRVTQQSGVEGIDGLNLMGRQSPPGREELITMLSLERRKQGHPRTLPLLAVVIPRRVKRSMIGHLETTYNRSRQALFPDVGGLADAFRAGEIGYSAPMDV